MLMVLGCWIVGEQVCVVEWVFGELEVFKEIDCFV